MVNDRMTVVQLVPNLESGGVEKGTLEVAAELVKRGCRSIVISGGGRLVPSLEKGGSEHTTWDIGKKSPLTLKYVRRLRRFLLENNVDIVHARSRVPAWVGKLALDGISRDVRPRFVTTCHGLYSVNYFSSIMVTGEVVIAISKTSENHVVTNFPELAKKTQIRRVYRGVEPDEFPRGYRPTGDWLARWYEEFPETRNKRIITLPGRLTRLKGQTTFIDIMTKLQELRPNTIGLIVGGEDPRRVKYAQSLRQLVADRNLNNVLFTGHRSDLRDILAISDLSLSLTSQPPEAFGRTSLEALSLGTPVVGFDGSGVGEILSELFPEGLIQPGDVNELVDRVISIFDGSPIVKPNQIFTLQNMLDGTMDVYNNLVADNRSSQSCAA